MGGPLRPSVRRAGGISLSVGLGLAFALGPAAAWLGDLPWFGLPIALAATPSPSPPLGDPRSPGQGPGFVGEPLLAIGLVLLIALLSVLVTAAYVRLSPGDRGRRR